MSAGITHLFTVYLATLPLTVIPDCTVLNCSMTGGQGIQKDVDGGGNGLLPGKILLSL